MDPGTSRGHAAHSIEPFHSLISTITREWVDVNGSIQEPVHTITRLHLETLALIRGLHCNLPRSTLGRSPQTPSRLSRQRSSSRDAARRDASSRLLALSSHVSGLREHVSQLYENSRLLVEAASSIEDELEVFGDQIEQLKAGSSRDHHSQPPSPMSPRTSESGSEEAEREQGAWSDSDGGQEATTPGLEDVMDTTRVDYFGDWMSANDPVPGRVRTKRMRDEEDEDTAQTIVRPERLAPPAALLRAQSAAILGAKELERMRTMEVMPNKRQRRSVQPMRRRASSDSWSSPIAT